MANITVEINDHFVFVDLGVYTDPPFNLESPFVINKDNIHEFGAYGDGVQVIVGGRKERTMYFSHVQLPPIVDENPDVEDIHFLIIDLIDGVKPNSSADIVRSIFNAK